MRTRGMEMGHKDITSALWKSAQVSPAFSEWQLLLRIGITDNPGLKSISQKGRCRAEFWTQVHYTSMWLGESYFHHMSWQNRTSDRITSAFWGCWEDKWCALHTVSAQSIPIPVFSFLSKTDKITLWGTVCLSPGICDNYAELSKTSRKSGCGA